MCQNGHPKTKGPVFQTLAFILVGFLAGGCKERASEPPPAAPVITSTGALNMHNRLGEGHLNGRKYSRAKSAFQLALESGEDSVRAFVGLGRTYLAQGDLTLAEETLARADSLGGPRPETSFALAELHLEYHLKTHRPELLQRAVETARQGLRLDPDQKAYFYLLGNLYARSNEADSAEAAYRQALELDPDLADAYNRLGNLYRAQGRFAAAEEAYRQQLKLQPENPQTLCDLALLCRADGRSREALQLLEKAVQLDTTLIAAYLNLGQLYLAEGRPAAGKKALKRFRQLSRDDVAELLARAEARPRDARAQVLLADAYIADNAYLDQAEQLYLKAIRLDGDFIAAWEGLGRFYLRQRRLAEAVQILLQALEKNPSAAELHLLLGEVYLLQQHPHKALENLQKAVQFRPEEKRAYELLATAYRQSGQHQKERHARERAEKLGRREDLSAAPQR